MATGQATKLTSAVGEFLVAAELCRRGMLATPFAGNVPHYDIIASGQSGGHVALQRKIERDHLKAESHAVSQNIHLHIQPVVSLHSDPRH